MAPLLLKLSPHDKELNIVNDAIVVKIHCIKAIADVLYDALSKVHISFKSLILPS